MSEPYRQTAEQVLQQQDVSAAQGLSSQQIEQRQREYGPNRLRRAGTRPAWRILLKQLESVVVILLISAALAAAAFARVLEALAIAAAVLVNTVIGFFMEWRATRAMEALQRMGKIQARVCREGKVQQLTADALVPGDIVLLEAGDMVAADLRLLESNELQCDEAALTGESVAVNKQVEALSGEDIPLGERSNMAYKGTAVTQGSGSGVVVATAMDTELGHISELVEQAEQAATPLEQRLDALGRRLAWVTLAIAVVVAGAGLLAGKDWLIMVETAIALAIAAVPEGLPVVSTLALARGMQRMARRNAVVKQLSAVETLGATSLIFTDKTGTLTENRMRLQQLALDTGILQREDDTWCRDDNRVEASQCPALQAALEVAALCNNAALDEDEAVGDPTEVALLEAAAGAGLQRRALLEDYPELREVSFDPQVKMMATYHRCDEDVCVAVKGAPEAVLPACTHLLCDDGERDLDDEQRRQWQQHSEELAGQGLRLLALARKRVAEEQAEPYENLTLIGLAGLYDPPRTGIKQAIAACQHAGIRVVMGTGDHAATAGAIAREIGLDGPDRVVQAAELPALEAPDKLAESRRSELLDTSVYARISPEQKLGLIRLYQQAGYVVGMTGDGVNDAPGLKKADIGIAMGQRGTEVARETADIVLKDDAFDTIVVAVEQGRNIFANIRRFIVYLLSGNLGEIMAISAAALVAAPLPMLPLQILYINFISDVMPALALGLSRSEPGVMDQPPRASGEPLLLRRHWLAIVAYGALIAAAVLSAFAIALQVLELTEAEAVTIGFLTFGFARLWHVFNMRNPASPLLLNEISRNPYVWLALFIGVALLLGAAYLPLLAQVLTVVAPDWRGWLLSLGFSLLPLVWVQVMKGLRLGWEKEAT